jgi:deoxyribonuclease-4
MLSDCIQKVLKIDNDKELVSVLSRLDAKTKKPFIKLMPQFDIPEECLLSVKYPTAILSALKNGENDNDEYSLLGVLCEKMLRHPLEKITIETLLNELKDCKDLKKISSSKTTPPFIEKLRQTRIEFDNVVKGKVVYDTVLEYKSVQGHPDGQTETQLFKVKMTGKEWKNFLLEAYSYGSLELRATELFLVLPLHGKVINLKLDEWPLKNRMKWRDLLASEKEEKNNDIQFGMIIQKRFNIGMHVQKKPSLVSTLEGLNDIQPFQIFLGNPSSAKLSISDIEYSKKAGCKGVVVHVGKSTTKPLSEAMENMRKTIADAMTFATPDCPLLLETPAGQGTETLTDREEFLGFVMSFGDPRLALCVDTCHVFTNGHDPLEYLQRAHETGLLRLVHFNDSATTCGACVDRHAYIGTGYLGPEKMAKLASFCSVIAVDMVIE